MEERVSLYYRDISNIVGSDGCSVVRLTDQDGSRAISVICDKAMTEQFMIRINNIPGHQQMMTEVLTDMLVGDGRCSDFELLVYGLIDGQYRVMMLNKRNLTIKKIRMSDAILIHMVSNIPLFIDNDLMARQCSPYHADATNIQIPINAISMERLKAELERAIQEEDYKYASQLHEEIKKRTKRERD